MTDFLATYGIDDRALAIGLKKIEGLAAQHARTMDATTANSSRSLLDGAGGKIGKGLLGVVGWASLAAATTMTVRVGIREVVAATEQYAAVNDDVAKRLREIGYEGEAAYQRLGREVSDLGTSLKSIKGEAIGGTAELLQNIRVMYLAYKTGMDPSVFRAGDAAKVAKENAKLAETTQAMRNAIDAERLSKHPAAPERLQAAELRAQAVEKEQLAKHEGLFWHLRNRGLNQEASRLERSIKLGAEQIVIDEKQRQMNEDIAGKNRVRADLEALKEKYDTSRRSTADVIESNAMKIFGLEASQRQLAISETQLRYDKQLRDLAADKALLEQDRVRAAGLLTEQRDTELAILNSQRGGPGVGRSIALGSSVDPRQAFAPIVNEERADRKAAQQKFDKMVAELRKIRENTASKAGATYQ